MTINKFYGKTEEEAKKKARAEFGENTVIMNVKEVKPKGLFRAFKSNTYEVTAAVEEKETPSAVKRPIQAAGPAPDAINLVADEKISIPRVQNKPDFSKTAGVEKKKMADVVTDKAKVQNNLEARLDNLSDQLEESLGHNSARIKAPTSEELNFVRILYNTMLANEVNEKYVNQVLGEVEKFIRPGNNVDVILSNVYQKLILRFGQPKTIDVTGQKPRVHFFIGPTGVGKTTTIAKLASKYEVEYDKKVAFITADTYRIAATEQLQVYANILGAPMSIIYSEDELNDAIAKYVDYDLIFVDTAGFSHKNEAQKSDVKKLIQGVDKKYKKEVYLVLSATTKYRDLMEIVDTYSKISDYKLIFTKLDETITYGNLLNVKLYSGAELSYVANGQNVPDDLEVFDTQKIVKKLLGGSS